ncbi:copper chaperone PCu(A)C [Streptomyces sp. gCLA4]|uniref:copper chaperone PCu(A)C n=1 Tax=Streptomyces sp. gCLA4 TaxID=1873416 RepID=UPI0015FF4D5B|nr:copper chaperone PCu(A)C [Streptomyces sp. gCLA4]
MSGLLRKMDRAVRRTVHRAVYRAVTAAEGRMPGRRSLRDGLPGVLLPVLVPVMACLTMLVGLTAWTKAGAAGSPARIDVGVGRVLVPQAGKEHTAAFFRIANTGDSDDQLVSVTSPAADGIVLNRHERGGEAGDAVRARAVPSANIPAGDFLVMTPATLDLTIRVKARHRVGDAIPFVLHFRRSGAVDAVAFVVRPAG